MKLNNKGFVISTLMYALLIVFLFLLIGIITLLSNRKSILDRLKKDVKNEINGMVKNDYYPNGTAIYFNPVTNKVCNDYDDENSINETKTGCMKWYAFNDSVNSNKVNLILDHNTTYKTDYNSAEINFEPREAKEELDALIYGSKWKSKPRLISADEIAKITGNDGWNSSSATSSQYFSFGSNDTTRYSSQTAEQKAKQESLAWLFDYTNCSSYGCNYPDSNSSGYWTSSPVSSNTNSNWSVIQDGSMVSRQVNDDTGIRPVITVDKKTSGLEVAITPNANILKECNGTTIICINNIDDFKRLSDEVNDGDDKSDKTFILSTDLNLGGKFDSSGNMQAGSTNWKPVGNYDSRRPFSGTFDGNGHVIKNLYINSNTSDNYIGFFGYTKNATIKNLGIEDSYVIVNGEMSGTLIGLATNTVIDKCYSKATIVGKKTTGGFIGLLSSSTIQNSYNMGIVNSSNSQFAGGIVGYSNGSSIIKNCYNASSIVNSGVESGGIVGGNSAIVSNSYNVGSIQATSSGGIAGQLYTNGKIQNSYNSGLATNSNYGGIVLKVVNDLNQEMSNNYYLDTVADYGIIVSSNSTYLSQTNNNAEPLTSSQMPTIISVINSDNAFIEDNSNINKGYPLLKWQVN